MPAILQIYHDSLCPLEKNPTVGVVSPPLMGSHGVLPLTIVAPLPDICRHMSNCIVRAKKEVFLATNFWIHSHASTLVTNAFRELSRRAGQRGTKVVVKVVYDRGAPQQVWENHLNVHEKDFTGEKVKLPAPEEIPNIDLQVVNYHRPIFGTFHAKFRIVDRRIALLQSSNIQDNDNLEMMVRVEGPIVDSLYDSALVSWGRPLGAPLPLLASPARSIPVSNWSVKDLDKYANGSESEQMPQHTPDHPHYDPDFQRETQRVNTSLDPQQDISRTQAVTRHLSMFLSHIASWKFEEQYLTQSRHHNPTQHHGRCP